MKGIDRCRIRGRWSTELATHRQRSLQDLGGAPVDDGSPLLAAAAACRSHQHQQVAEGAESDADDVGGQDDAVAGLPKGAAQALRGQVPKQVVAIVYVRLARITCFFSTSMSSVQMQDSFSGTDRLEAPGMQTRHPSGLKEVVVVVV